jgi:hypothetical protein
VGEPLSFLPRRRGGRHRGRPACRPAPRAADARQAARLHPGRGAVPASIPPSPCAASRSTPPPAELPGCARRWRPRTAWRRQCSGSTRSRRGSRAPTRPATAAPPRGWSATSSTGCRRAERGCSWSPLPTTSSPCRAERAGLGGAARRRPLDTAGRRLCSQAALNIRAWPVSHPVCHPGARREGETSNESSFAGDEADRKLGERQPGHRAGRSGGAGGAPDAAREDGALR